MSRARRGALPAFVDEVVQGTAPVEPSGCVLWPFGVDGHGYPCIKQGERMTLVGRVVLERTQGPPPSSGHTMGHAPHEVCGHRRCVASAHLSWQTRAQQIEHQIYDGTFMYRTHTPAEVARALDLVESGLSIRAAARAVGASHSSVRRWIAAPPRTHQTSPSTRTA